MFSRRKKQTESKLQWDAAATQALNQAMQQAPVPSLLKGKVRSELAKAAEAHAESAGHATVTAEDLMQGLLAKMPAQMKSKVEAAMQQGPEGLKDLEKELKK